MSKLELLKNQIDNMNLRIKNMNDEINTKKSKIINIKSQREQIEILLNTEDELYKTMVHQYEYLLEVQNTTTTNYNQLEEAATTLLEILAKSGGISPRGKAKIVKVMRKVGDKREIYKIDISTIDGLKYADMIIQGDDYIYIEPRTRLIQGAITELAPILSLMSTFAVVYTLIKKY